MIDNQNINFKFPFGQRILYFILFSAAGLLLCSFLMLPFMGNSSPRILRILTLLQEVMVFIIPPVLTAVIVTRRPADLLCVRNGFSFRYFLLAFLTFLVSVPAMNYIVEWNSGLTLPPFLESWETKMRAMEEAAEATVRLLIGDYNGGGFLMAVLGVGIGAGLSEEMFFRGGLQRLLATASINRHAAVWITAAIFSAIHFQFFGFIPRLLLGAFFGYLLMWSGSLWLPILMHTINNSMVVASDFYTHFTGSEGIEKVGTSTTVTDIVIVIVSILLTSVGIWALSHYGKQPKTPLRNQ